MCYLKLLMFSEKKRMEVPLSSSSTVRLIIERIPFDLTETGLWNYLESKKICPLLDLR